MSDAPGVRAFFEVTAEAAGPEHLDVLVETPHVRVERIVSLGHVTPPGQWYDQPRDEWVLLVAGRAELAFDDGSRLRLAAGDHVRLRAHLRHRVEWTDPDQACFWLAVHFDGGHGDEPSPR